MDFYLQNFKYFAKNFWNISQILIPISENSLLTLCCVTSILFDLYNRKVNKDIIAVLLDLCAKKYITLSKQNDKHIISVSKTWYISIICNERYILSSIINNNLKNLDYNVWYNHCLNDGINQNLFSYKKRENYFSKDYLKISDSFYL